MTSFLGLINHLIAHLYIISTCFWIGLLLVVAFGLFKDLILLLSIVFNILIFLQHIVNEFLLTLLTLIYLYLIISTLLIRPYPIRKGFWNFFVLDAIYPEYIKDIVYCRISIPVRPRDERRYISILAPILNFITFVLCVTFTYLPYYLYN